MKIDPSANGAVNGLAAGSWSPVVSHEPDGPTPAARSKHSATLLSGNVYLLGGRNGNVPLKDFWRYNLADGRWEQLQPSGDRPPCLQEHSAVVHRDCIFVFGGELSFSSGADTPLWMYNVAENSWRRIRARPGVTVPRGRRGHTALVHRGSMLIYGGYQDMRGSCADLWAFHFETESWHLLWSGKENGGPAARHKHSAVLHGDFMWIYGGMTDLQERNDLWRWDTTSSIWSQIRAKHSPGNLHSHAVCRLPSSMLLFGGETSGHPSNEVWKFHFGMETWEKLTVAGIKPQPRSESVAFAVSDLLLKGQAETSLQTRAARTRSRTAERHSSYIPQEQTYIFEPSEDYVDGSEDQPSATPGDDRASCHANSFFKEITKLSQMNLSRIQNKCSYSVLASKNDNSSTESLLRQHSTAAPEPEETGSPARMVKSKSAHVINKRKQQRQRMTRSIAECSSLMPREPISMPNFATLTLPTPVLTPVEAARLVFLDSEEEKDLEDEPFEPPLLSDIINVKPSTVAKEPPLESFRAVKRDESYSSHLGYANSYLQLNSTGSSALKKTNTSSRLKEAKENTPTSDYASMETMNRLSSGLSGKAHFAKEEEFKRPSRNQVAAAEGPFGFCNPNYMGPDGHKTTTRISWEDDRSKQFVRALNTPDSVLEDAFGRSTSHYLMDGLIEMQTMTMTDMEPVKVKQTRFADRKVPPKSLELDSPLPAVRHCKCDKNRAASASRAERDASRRKEEENSTAPQPIIQPGGLYMFVFGGKEQGQVTVFKRPMSIWQLKLY